MGMFQNIFRKADLRGMDQLIFDLAEHGNRPADLKELYRRLPTMELFAKVLSANFPLQSAAMHKIQVGEILQIQTGSLPDGRSFAQFFSDQTDRRLLPQYVGLSPKEACEMVLKMDGLSGLLICNSKNSWVALLKPELERLIKCELSVS